MDKNIRNFIYYSLLLIVSFIALIVVFTFIYRYFTINAYNYILLILMLLMIIITVLFTFTTAAVFYTYKKGRVIKFLSWPVRIGLEILLPLLLLLSGVFEADKDAIRKLYIDINNIFVESADRKYDAEQILVLLPHCLQQSNCVYKVTSDINNCKRCGKCCIGEIAKMAENFRVAVQVVTGGTAARNVISRNKPEMILSVACERDLAVGITDVQRIPVLGVVNERPNGPCSNTTVNVETLKRKLEGILEIAGGRGNG